MAFRALTAAVPISALIWDKMKLSQFNTLLPCQHSWWEFPSVKTDQRYTQVDKIYKTRTGKTFKHSSPKVLCAAAFKWKFLLLLVAFLFLIHVGWCLCIRGQVSNSLRICTVPEARCPTLQSLEYSSQGERGGCNDSSYETFEMASNLKIWFWYFWQHNHINIPDRADNSCGLITKRWHELLSFITLGRKIEFCIKTKCRKANKSTCLLSNNFIP